MASSSALTSPPSVEVSPSFVETVNRFGFHLQSLSLLPDESSGICAMNIYHCLAMAAAGSKDRNLAAFGHVMGFDPANIDPMLSNTVNLDSYSKTSPAVDFSSASSIWHKPSFILGVPWKELVQRKFNATVGPLNLSAVNGFIEKETHGKLKDLITDVSGADLMLITCLYFKANWQIPFKRSETQVKGQFFGFDAKEQSCAMMKMYEDLEYESNSDSQVCVLPYQSDKKQGPKWKAAIILPKQRGVDAMRRILTKFATSPETLHTTLFGALIASSGRGARRRRSKVSLFLPRFSMKLNLDLIPGLSELGLGPAFSASRDFAPISLGPLMISRATHDLVIEVNEEGTEMAAVTVLAMSRSMPMFDEMRVDRPFIFIVFDAETGLVLCQIAVNQIPKAEAAN